MGLRGERLELVDLGQQALVDVQPAEPVADLGLARGAPERVVALEDPARDLLVAGTREARVDRRRIAGSGSTRRSPRGRSLATAFCLDSMPSSSFSIGVTNASTPSLQQLVGDVVEVDAGVGQRLEVGASGRSARVGSVASLWSAAASSVAIGIVLTVSGPASSSTYMTSEYLGFLTPVEAHSGRCTGAPASRSVAKRSPSKTFR